MKKILIANRGEIACRIIRTCKTIGLKTIAVYSEADANSKHVAEADEAALIGPSAAKDSYLVAENIISAAQKYGAHAIHPGYGFLAENAKFANSAKQEGLIWIGPSPKTISDMGDKEHARDLAIRAGVPTVPGSARFSSNDNQGLASAAKCIGFPLLVKATAGGGGIGMKQVSQLEDLESTVTATQSLAEKAFGNGTIYLEKLVEQPRHIEIQVFGFGDKRAIHFFERECSIQRRFQKIIEESPAPGLPSQIRTAMCDAALALTEQESYQGAGTIEFILAPNGDFFFLEMNTRIQVEHPVSEMITNYDLVQLQLELALGSLAKPPKQSQISSNGHAIECRIYAENPAKNFLPSPGFLEVYTPPQETNELRIDTGVRQGDQITYFYDPMIAKVIAYGIDRENARKKLLQGLCDFNISGIITNLEFIKNILQHPQFINGNIDTGFVEKYKSDIIDV